MTRVALLTSARVLLFAPVAMAMVLSADGADAGDKSQYTLSNPTPKELMREMTTDRPDKTESPYTVDAGHFQFEMDLVNYTYDRERAGGVDTRVDSFAIAPINLKVGLCNQADLQVVVGTWNYVRTETSGTGGTLHQRGFGDVTTRLKYNFWGNEYVYRKNTSTSQALAVFNKMAASTGINANADGANTIKLDDMHASRNGPTTDPVHH